MDRFIMTTHTTLSAARRPGWMDGPGVARVLRRQTLTQATTLLIANLELKLIVSNRKTSSLKIPNRKKIAISLSTKWRNHSCLCVPAKLRIRPTEAVTSLPSSFQNLIETPRLEFPATTTKLSPLPISNRDKMATFIVAALPLAPQPNHLFRRPAEPKDCPSPALRARITSHDSQITSHEFLSTRPITFSASTPVLDFAQQFCSEENFPAVTANRWNFGLCATIPREPRQARKGATVTGQLRVPRNTRSSSLAPEIWRTAVENLLLPTQENRDSTTLKTYLPPIRGSYHSEATSLKSRVTDRIVGLQ